MPSQSTLNAKLSALSKKVPEFSVKSVELPESSADYFTLFNTNSSAASAAANVWTIDLFPSQVTPICYYMHLASEISAHSDHKLSPKITVASITAYLLAIHHGYFLLNDMFVRPSPSDYAQLWHDSSARHEFAEFLLSLPVPEQMMTILNQYTPTNTERTTNVFFVPSAAGFSHNHFYGRYFPVSIFTHMHDIIATLPSNSPRNDVYNALLRTIIYTHGPVANRAAAFTSYLGDYFGYDITDAAATYLNAKLHQVFSSTFNPVLFRDYQRRSHLASIDLAVPKFPDVNMNPYDVLFSYTPSNLKELKVVLQSIASNIFDKTPSKHNLGQVVSTASGIQILDHGYSTFQVPTWFNNVSPVPGTSFKPSSFLERSNNTTFLTPGTLPAATHSTKYFTYSATRVTGSTFSAIWPFSLVMPAPSATVSKPSLENDFITIDEENEARYGYPKVLVLDVQGDKTVSAPLATFSGKIIESFELDGCTIEMPNVDKSLGMQNCIFSDSLIPITKCIWATRIKNNANDASHHLPRPLFRTAANSTTSLPASSLLHDRTKVMLPHLHKTIRDPLTANASPAMESLPGMTRVDEVNWIAIMQSFLGFRTVPTDKFVNNEHIPAMNKLLYVWSPYSYTAMESTDTDVKAPTYPDRRVYFVTNLRSFFGTDFNLVSVSNPLEAIPIL